jgi:glucan-binding YG repeat protein
VEKLADIEKDQLQKYKIAVAALNEAKQKNLKDKEIDSLTREVENEKSKFSLSGYYVEMADQKRTKRQNNDRNGKIYYCCFNYVIIRFIFFRSSRTSKTCM